MAGKKISSLEKRLLAQKAEIFKAIGHPLRLAILEFIKDGEKTVSEITEFVGSEQSNVSRHLAVLKQTGIVDCRKDGLNVYYYLKIRCILNATVCMDSVLRTQMETQSELLDLLESSKKLK